MTTTEITNALNLFGYNQFNKGQLESTSAILNDKRDICVTMSTGAGKSLCFQLAPIVERQQGIITSTIVISPLISLMQDQVKSLNDKIENIACFLGSAQDDINVERDALNGKYALIYVTPEKIISEYFRNKLSSLQILSIAVDEAHCLSEYGNSFRPDYKKLSDLKKYFKVPIITLTATATKKSKI